MNNFSFAIPAGYDYDIKVFIKEVKTKKWTKIHKACLFRYVDRITTARADKVQIIGGMLQNAYGANIGRQIEQKLQTKDFEKIASNLLALSGTY